MTVKAAADRWTTKVLKTDECYLGAFLALYRREELHAGLVCLTIEPSVRGIDLQLAVFTALLEELTDEEPYNDVLDVQIGKDRNVSVSRYHWTAASTPPPRPARRKRTARRKS